MGNTAPRNKAEPSSKETRLSFFLNFSDIPVSFDDFLLGMAGDGFVVNHRVADDIACRRRGYTDGIRRNLRASTAMDRLFLVPESADSLDMRALKRATPEEKDIMRGLSKKKILSVERIKDQATVNEYDAPGSSVGFSKKLVIKCAQSSKTITLQTNNAQNHSLLLKHLRHFFKQKSSTSMRGQGLQTKGTTFFEKSERRRRRSSLVAH
eukprot:CAMPEP_0194685898 /NCGR_PEP_ID=MMETSP0295-20121207/15129_1 /TAXON_ID=39354 /ORGANISM="Heterosigma akashiwo, Strain CCMP2393" /LENGTH=208 /DNA_ID=CAMNT_0039573515 /DNA_START=74 /DNA_END=700 /DNA_ORIENTATION=+